MKDLKKEKQKYEGIKEEQKEKKPKRNFNVDAEYAIAVRVPDNSKETLEIALRRFKKIVKESGVLDRFKEIQSYEKPSEKRRKQKIQAIRNMKREQRMGQ